ncbi:MAG: hypothetical protein KDA58_02400 [Planctomycetaceae bacterium]|nr:hypothetical protein [Planctomycetaceae bacterium]
MQRYRLIVVCLCGLLLTGVIQAQEVGPGTLSLNPRWDAIRTHAPMFYEAKLGWPKNTLLRGELQLECMVGPQLQCRTLSHPTALAETGLTLDVVLPPPLVNREEESFIVRANYLGETGTMFLDEHFLVGQVRWKRTMVVGVIEDRPGTIPAGMVETTGDPGEFFRSVTIEDYVPLVTKTQQDPTGGYRSQDELVALLRGWTQTVTNIPPAELPSEPLQLLAFDVLAISSDRLALLSAGQLEALRLWTQGGGSLAVSLNGKVSANLLPWLNQVAGGTTIEPVVGRMSDGTVRLLGEVGTVRRGFPGVGRSVLVSEPTSVAGSEWKKAILHLWKVRDEQQAAVLWNFKFKFDPQQDWTRRDPMEMLPWDVAYDSHATTVTGLLLPESVQGVPLWMVCSLLAGCLLIVVPGDYLVLGGLKLRRWTWMIMPVIAIAFAWSMFRTANAYMGTQDYLQRLTYIDLNQDGQPVRWSQFQLAFPASTKTSEHAQQGVLELDFGEGRSAAMDPAQIEETINSAEPDSYQRSETRDLPRGVAASDAPEYIGVLPGDYTVRRRLNQWTPRVSRLTSFRGLPDLPTTQPPVIDPDRLDGLFEQGGEALRAAFAPESPQAAVLVWHKGEFASAEPTATTSRFAKITQHVIQQTSRSGPGLFTILSQVSPQGADITEDLALDTFQTVVVVIVPDADESSFVAWRQLIPRS